MRARTFRFSAALVAVASATSTASAAGLFATDRGVRPLGRGGAFVAGADDLGAIWYNPAGLADAGTSVLFDASLLLHRVAFTRRAATTDSAGAIHEYAFPTTNGASDPVPVPTIAGSWAFGAKKEWTAALGMFAPMSPLTHYPADAPSRYSLVTLHSSALVVLGGWAAYEPVRWLRIGAGVEALAGKFASQVVASSSPPDRVLAAPEDPTFDTPTQLTAHIFAPSGNLGVIAAPIEQLRIGASFQLPFVIDAPATMDVRFPTAPEFDQAKQEGRDARLRFEIPPILRVGVEGRPIERLRVELAWVRELWHLHDKIAIDPQGVRFSGITGFPSGFEAKTMTIPRNYRDSDSLRLGVEYGVPVGTRTLDLRAGGSWERGAARPEYVTPLTADLDKITLGVGAGFHVTTSLRLDLVYAHVFSPETTVDPSTAAVPALNPVHGYPTRVEAINGGTYRVSADVLGLGARLQL